MTVDATVYCDCIERGRVRPAPPEGLRFDFEEGGQPEPIGAAISQPYGEAYGAWIDARPCPHEGFKLHYEELGNIAGMAWLREAFAQLEDLLRTDFPVITQRIIYDGVHGGDWLSLADVERLRGELERLRMPLDWTPPQVEELDPATPEQGRAFLADFVGRLRRLVEASAQVGKPISF